jgi:hypothetical protein
MVVTEALFGKASNLWGVRVLNFVEEIARG